MAVKGYDGFFRHDLQKVRTMRGFERKAFADLRLEHGTDRCILASTRLHGDNLL